MTTLESYTLYNVGARIIHWGFWWLLNLGFPKPHCNGELYLAEVTGIPPQISCCTLKLLMKGIQ